MNTEMSILWSTLSFSPCFEFSGRLIYMKLMRPGFRPRCGRVRIHAPWPTNNEAENLLTVGFPLFAFWDPADFAQAEQLFRLKAINRFGDGDHPIGAERRWPVV